MTTTNNDPKMDSTIPTSNRSETPKIPTSNQEEPAQEPKPAEAESGGREPYIELEKDEKGQWHWCLFAKNGRPLCMNITPYPRRNDCQNALETVLELMKRPRIKIVAALD